MRRLAADTVAACANRHLTYPAYSAILNHLNHFLDRCQVLSLWCAAFDDDPPEQHSTWSLEMLFLDRVNAELFPFDIVMINSFYYSGEEPLDCPIPVIGFRIPWEIMAGCDLSPYQSVVGDCIAYTHAGEDEYDSDLDVPYVEWLAGDGAGAALEWLAALEPPFNGLSDLVRLAIQLHPTGNPFLDFPDDHALAIMEYAYNNWYWTPEDLKYLAEQFDGVRDVVARIRAFRIWFDSQIIGNANQRVAQLLLEAGRQ